MCQQKPGLHAGDLLHRRSGCDMGCLFSALAIRFRGYGFQVSLPRDIRGKLLFCHILTALSRKKKVRIREGYSSTGDRPTLFEECGEAHTGQ